MNDVPLPARERRGLRIVPFVVAVGVGVGALFASFAIASKLEHDAPPDDTPPVPLVVGALPVPPPRLTPSPWEQVETLLNRADARLRERLYADALADATAAVQLDPRSTEALTLKAEARYFLTQESSRRAITLADLDRTLLLDPDNARALALRAYVRLERDRVGDLTSLREDQDLARADAEWAIRLDPRWPLSHLALAELAHARRDMAAALRHANAAVVRGDHLAITHMRRGLLRAYDGDDQAIQDFAEARRLDPTNASAMINEAALLIARKDFDAAAAHLERALSLDPEHPEGFFQRAMLRLTQRPRQLEPAITDLSRAIELRTQFPAAYFYRACAFHDLKLWDRCLEDLAMAEAQRKDESRGFDLREVLLARGHCLFFKDELTAARDAYQAYLGLAAPGASAIAKVKQRLAEIEARLAPR